MTAALDLYAAGLEGVPLHLRDDEGAAEPVPVDRWLGPLTAADHAALDRADGPVLDVGCGPGRHVLALARRGVLAQGIDLSPAAVRLARDRGAEVLQGSVFATVPGAGTWGSALLLDGNIGIGGDPVVLLERVRTLLRHAGTAIVEVDAPGTRSGPRRVRLEAAAGASEWFAWARVGVDDLDRLARRSGFVVRETWCAESRWFTVLEAR